MPCGYTPKHGSWLNIAEIELAVLSDRCLSRRIPDKDTLRREVDANVQERTKRLHPSIGVSPLKTHEENWPGYILVFLND